MFDWVFNRFFFSVGWPRLQSRVLHQSRGFPEVTWVWGVSAVVILDSSVNCVCVWSTKKLTMPAYCFATNCNNSQTTPGITVHELPHNRPTVRQKWIQFIQFKRAEKSCLACSNWYGCILVGLSGKVSVSSSELKLAILQWLPRVT